MSGGWACIDDLAADLERREVDRPDDAGPHHGDIGSCGVRANRETSRVPSNRNSRDLGERGEIDHRNVETAPVRDQEPGAIRSDRHELGDRTHRDGAIDGQRFGVDSEDETVLPSPRIAVVVGIAAVASAVELVVRHVDVPRVRSDGGFDGGSPNDRTLQSERRRVNLIVDDLDDLAVLIEHHHVVSIHHVLREEQSGRSGHDALRLQPLIGDRVDESKRLRRGRNDRGGRGAPRGDRCRRGRRRRLNGRRWFRDGGGGRRCFRESHGLVRGGGTRQSVAAAGACRRSDQGEHPDRDAQRPGHLATLAPTRSLIKEGCRSGGPSEAVPDSPIASAPRTTARQTAISRQNSRRRLRL